jgi:hypothetical protein
MDTPSTNDSADTFISLRRLRRRLDVDCDTAVGPSQARRRARRTRLGADGTVYAINNATLFALGQ